MTGAELTALLAELFPTKGSLHMTVDEVGGDGVVLRQRIVRRHLRPGGTVSGPTLMTLADTAVYLSLIARDQRHVASVTSDLHMRFLRRPGAEADLVARCRLLRVGRVLASAAVEIDSEGQGLVAHATLSYALPAS